MTTGTDPRVTAAGTGGAQAGPAHARSSSSRARLVAWLGILVGVVYLTIGGGGATPGVTLIQFRIISLTLIAIALTVWLAVALRLPAYRPRTVLWPAFVAALAAFAISTATSWNPRLSLEYMAYAVLCAALYLLLVRLLADPFFRLRLGALAVILCASIGVLYIVLVLGHWISWWSVVGRITTPPLRPASESLALGNPSAVATMMLLLGAAAVAYVGTATLRRRLLDVALLALTAVVVFLTGSRGAWLGSGIGLGALGTAVVLLPETRHTVRRALAQRAVRYGGVVAVMAMVVAAVALLPALITRLTDTDALPRLSFYLAAIRIFLSAPILGSGPGTWAPRRVDFTDSSGVDLYIPHAHDIYLQTLAEFGLAGILAGAVVVACLGWLVLRALGGADPARRRYGWAALFAVTYLAGHQLVDFYANQPAVFFALALTVGYLDATSEPLPVHLPARARVSADRVRPVAVRLALVALPVAVVSALAFSSWSESVALVQSRAVDAANSGDWSRSLQLARQAVTSDPLMPPNQYVYGLAAAATGQLTEARDAFTRVATADGFPEAWLDLAAIDLQLDHTTAARASLDQAMRLGYQQSTVAVPAAGMYAELGEPGAAAQAVADALVVAPELAGDPYWSSTPALRSAWQAGLTSAIATSGPSTGYQLALFAGNVADAERIAASLGPASSRTAGLFIQAWLGDRAALGTLAETAVAHPLDTSTVALAQSAASHLGDQSLAVHEAGIGLQGGSATLPAGAELHIGTRCELCQVVPGANASVYGLYTYRRPLPADLLVLDLPRLSYR